MNDKARTIRVYIDADQFRGAAQDLLGRHRAHAVGRRAESVVGNLTTAIYVVRVILDQATLGTSALRALDPVYVVQAETPEAAEQLALTALYIFAAGDSGWKVARVSTQEVPGDAVGVILGSY